jgi:hypothetical protein
MPPPSPRAGGASPPTGISREGSIGGNLVTLATTPTAVTKQKKVRLRLQLRRLLAVSAARGSPSRGAQPTTARHARAPLRAALQPPAHGPPTASG